MKKLFILLVGCIVFSACTDNHGAKTEAQKVVLQYLLAGTPETRATYVKNPQEVLPLMQKMYNNRNVSWKDSKFKFIQEESGPNGAFITVASDNHKSNYVLYKESNTWKIDWPLSQFLNGTSPTGDTLKKMYMDVDKQKHSLFVNIGHHVYYNYSFSNDERSMYSFRMNDSSMNQSVYGYCYKNNAECKELFNKFKEKSNCIVSLDAWYPNKVFRYYTVVGDHAEIGNIKIQLCM